MEKISIVFKNLVADSVNYVKNVDSYTRLLILLLFSAFLVRIININYNSAFNDEAIYVVIGRMGLFTNDWWSYGAKLWMAGIPYIYPPMTALAHELGGILGSRLLNVLLGVLLVEEVWRFVNLLNLFDKKTNRLAALIAAFLVAFSGIGIFVSKLATYDLPSFLFFMIGINSFLKARDFANGKYYFLTFFFLFLAFLTKITIAIFFPIIFILSILIMKSRAMVHRKKAIAYLYVPFALATLIYTGIYWENLMVYVETHKDLGIASSAESLLVLIWEETYILLLLAIPNVFLLFTSKKAKEAVALVALAAAIPAFHLALLRFSTLDKHLYLTVIFLSAIAGLGVAFALSEMKGWTKKILLVGIPVVAVFYLINSQYILNIRQNDWTNSNNAQAFLKDRVQPGDKILTEEGGAVILAVYDKVFPPKSIATFDWINYSGLSGDKGYVQAVHDQYFDYVELNGRYEGAYELREKIREGMGGNYSLVYTNKNYVVYEKNK